VASREHRFSHTVAGHLSRGIVEISLLGGAPRDEARSLIPVNLRELNVGNSCVFKKAKNRARVLWGGHMVGIKADHYIVLGEPNQVEPGIVVSVLAAGREGSTVKLVLRQSGSAKVLHR